MEPPTLDLVKAAALLRLPVDKMRKLAEQGVIPAIRAKDDWTFRREQLIQWKRSQDEVRFRQIGQRLDGIKHSSVQVESTATFDLSVLDELEPPES